MDDGGSPAVTLHPVLLEDTGAGDPHAQAPIAADLTGRAGYIDILIY